MTYDEAKNQQVEAFEQGRYYIVRESDTGEFHLLPTTSRDLALASIQTPKSQVIRMPARLRAIRGDG